MQFSIIFGGLIDQFSDPDDIDFESIVDGLVIWFIVLGLAVMAASTCSYGCYMYVLYSACCALFLMKLHGVSRVGVYLFIRMLDVRAVPYRRVDEAAGRVPW